MKKLLEADGEGTEPARKSPVIAKLLDGEAKETTAATTALVPKLVSVLPPGVDEKQNGPVTVIMLTPYGATETKGLVAALAEIDKKVGKIGKVYFEGSFAIGRKLPRLAPKYDVVTCVRDDPAHLLAFKHLGGSGRHTDPMEEVRERLDDEDRLLRRDETSALEDMIDMASGIIAFALMPGSTRIALAEQTAAALGTPITQTPKQPGLDYVDDIAGPPAPATLLVVTPEDYTDVGALIVTRAHLAYLGRKVGKIVHTPSMAMEVLAGLNDGTLFEEINFNDALDLPYRLFDASPDYVVVAGNTELGAAAANIAEHSTPKIPCAELP